MTFNAGQAEPWSASMSMNRTALMLAFYFPPFAQSTGSQRVLSFVRHLPMHDWRPVVLTARERLFPAIDAGSLSLIPPSTEVVRAWGLDVARDLSINGRYPRWLAIPDRWAAWALGACLQGLSVGACCVRRTCCGQRFQYLARYWRPSRCSD